MQSTYEATKELIKEATNGGDLEKIIQIAYLNGKEDMLKEISEIDAQIKKLQDEKNILL